MSDIDDQLNALGNEYDELRGREIIPEKQAGDEEPGDEEPKNQDPPGHLSYEEWTAAGKDPELYKGKKAYEAEFERLQEVQNGAKEVKDGAKEVKELKKMVRQITESQSDWQKQQTALIRADLEKQLKQATTDEDVPAALDAQKKISELSTTETVSEERPAIQKFRADNPILDKSSPDYNLKFDTTVQSFYNTKAQALGMMNRKDVTEEEVQDVLDYAMREAKAFLPTLFKSGKNARSTAAKTGKSGEGKQDSRARLKTVVIDSKNPRNRTAAIDIHDFLKEKYGDDFDGDKFANNVAGE